MSVTPAPDPLVGQLISGRYRVLDVLGSGGMGQVYLAEHETIEKRIALKVLHPEYSRKREIVERFKQEAISASRIKHPNVLEVFDFGELDSGSCFIAMELLEGHDLGAALESNSALRSDQALAIVLQVCRALGAAHARGVVHRDLKPENIFLQRTQEGEQIVKIVDFGIAQLRSTDEAARSEEGRRRRLTKTGMIFGTPEYMAPEQARGQTIDERSDIYSTAVILFELLTGAVPFLADSFLEVLNKHVMFPVPRMVEIDPKVQVSADLEAVVRRALAKAPADRYQSMAEFAEALRATPEGLASKTPSYLSLPDAKKSSPMAREAVTEVRGTPLASTTDAHVAKRGGAVWVGLAAALAVLGAGAFAWSRMGEGEGDGAAKDAALQGVVERASAASATPVSNVSPAEIEEPPPEEPLKVESEVEPEPKPQGIALHVETDPPGAVLSKDGFQVCDATPCEVLAKPDEAVTLQATLGARSGTARVLAQREQTVKIQLRAPVKASARPSTSQAPAKSAAAAPRMCEVLVDGLKILRPCE